MTSDEWQRHKDVWCERCTYNSKRKPCPAIGYMDSDPNDALCVRFIRGDHCTQYKPKPERKTKRKTKRPARKGNAGELRMNEPDWKDVESQLSALTLKELRPIKAWFNGAFGGAATKRDIVGTMVSQMRRWWRMEGVGHARVQNVLRQLREVEKDV